VELLLPLSPVNSLIRFMIGSAHGVAAKARTGGTRIRYRASPPIDEHDHYNGDSHDDDAASSGAQHSRAEQENDRHGGADEQRRHERDAQLERYDGGSRPIQPFALAG
jgi:hypothetical protein